MLKKFFAKFQNQELYNAFKISKDFATPNISKIVTIKKPVCIKLTNINWASLTDGESIASIDVPEILHKINASYSDNTNAEVNVVSLNAFDDNECKIESNKYWFKRPGIYFIKGIFGYKRTNNFIKWVIKEPIITSIKWEDNISLNMIQSETAPIISNKVIAAYSNGETQQFDFTSINVYSDNTCKTLAPNDWYNTPGVYYIKGKYNNFITSNYITYIIKEEDHDYYLYVGHEDPNTLDLNNIDAGSFINNEMSPGWVNLTQAGISIDDNTQFDIYVEGTTIGKWYIAIPKPFVSTDSNYTTVAAGLEKMTNNVIIINGNEYNVFTIYGESLQTTMWFTSIDNVTDHQHIFTEDHDYYLYAGHKDPNTLDLNNINAGSFINNEMSPGWINLTKAGISIDDNTRFDIYVEGNELAKWYIASPKPLVSTDSNYATVASGLEKMTNNVIMVKGHEYNVFTIYGESLQATMWFTSINNVNDPQHIFT